MAEVPATVEIPDRALFKASEVCELAKVQPYVLRSWEAEFRDLGVTRNGSTARVYRREDVERVLRIKHLVLIEGLTLAGVRRKFEEEQEPPLELDMPSRGTSDAVSDSVRERVGRVRRDLKSLLDLLSAAGPPSEAGETRGTATSTAADFALAPPAHATAATAKRPKRNGTADDRSTAADDRQTAAPEPPPTEQAASRRRKRPA